ncbi:hypothetical protein K8I61_02565 [bacterium]|nr:hypothetical protein [bacterium]
MAAYEVNINDVVRKFEGLDKYDDDYVPEIFGDMSWGVQHQGWSAAKYPDEFKRVWAAIVRHREHIRGHVGLVRELRLMAGEYPNDHWWWSFEKL